MAVPMWEVGSEFPWDPAALASDPPSQPWLPDTHRLFSTATGAMTSLLRLVGTRPRVHLPTFFCMQVAQDLSRSADISWYRQLPDGCGPRLDTLRAQPGDLVVAVNLFGRERREPWESWAAAHPDVTVIEDHSHDPLSTWARRSTAPYCVASLRKTLPIPDGALLWSPRDVALPGHPEAPSVAGGLKLAAMILKAAWQTRGCVPKELFRRLQVDGERLIHEGAPAPTAFTSAVLPLLDVDRMRSVRKRNQRALERRLCQAVDNELSGHGFRVLTHTASGSVPFNVQVLSADRVARDAFVAHMCAHHIFTPVHWPQDDLPIQPDDPDALAFSRRILTIPADHRYTLSDIEAVADRALAFLTRGTPSRC